MDLQNKTSFLVKCGCASTLVEAPDPIEAATIAFTSLYLRYGADIEVGPSIEAIDLEGLKIGGPEDKNTHLVYTPLAMANAGYHGLASNFYRLLEELHND